MEDVNCILCDNYNTRLVNTQYEIYHCDDCEIYFSTDENLIVCSVCGNIDIIEKGECINDCESNGVECECPIYECTDCDHKF